MTPDPPPWWAVATTTPPPGWTDRDQWEAMPPGDRLAAWREYRSTPDNNKEHQHG